MDRTSYRKNSVAVVVSATIAFLLALWEYNLCTLHCYCVLGFTLDSLCIIKLLLLWCRFSLFLLYTVWRRFLSICALVIITEHFSMRLLVLCIGWYLNWRLIFVWTFIVLPSNWGSLASYVVPATPDEFPVYSLNVYSSFSFGRSILVKQKMVQVMRNGNHQQDMERSSFHYHPVRAPAPEHGKASFVPIPLATLCDKGFGYKEHPFRSLRGGPTNISQLLCSLMWGYLCCVGRISPYHLCTVLWQ